MLAYFSVKFKTIKKSTIVDVTMHNIYAILIKKKHKKI